MRLTENVLRKMVKECLMEAYNEVIDDNSNNFEEASDDMYGYDDMYNDESDAEYKWFVHINEKKTESSRSFNSVDEAVDDCDEYLDTINFAKIARKYNKDDNDENCIACIELMQNGEPYDTMLTNSGWGWMD